jgi:hypothetical protein
MPYDLRPYPHPGKFEGGRVIDEWIYSLSLNGCDDEAGDCQEFGKWCGLLKGPFKADGPFRDLAVTDGDLTDDEVAFLGTRAGAVVTEDSQGFVSVSYWHSPDKLDAHWQRVVHHFDDLAAGFEEDDHILGD